MWSHNPVDTIGLKPGLLKTVLDSPHEDVVLVKETMKSVQDEKGSVRLSSVPCRERPQADHPPLLIHSKDAR
jgi:hypothetical protein